MAKFQSTHPRRVWRGTDGTGVPMTSGFNPHTHEGCDYHWYSCFQDTGVSIHTPTKGVTQNYLKISIKRDCFNPHTHEGCDEGVNMAQKGLMVSIHTPTKGVTPAARISFALAEVSIHTPTKGVTAYSANSWISWCKDNYFAKDGKIIIRKIL